MVVRWHFCGRGPSLQPMRPQGLPRVVGKNVQRRQNLVLAGRLHALRFAPQHLHEDAHVERSRGSLAFQSALRMHGGQRKQCECAQSVSLTNTTEQRYTFARTDTSVDQIS